MDQKNARDLIAKYTGETLDNYTSDGSLHVAFWILDKLTDPQWCEIRPAHHDVTDKGIVFFK